MAMTYTTLTGAKTAAGSIKSWVNYTRIDAEVVLENAQALIYQTLRVTQMKSMATLTLAVGDTTEPLPTGFLDPIGGGKDSDGNKYEHIPEVDRFIDFRTFDSTGAINSAQPQFWCVFDNVINFEHKFDTARTIYLPHFKSLPLLAADNLTNFLTDRYPHVLKTACNVEAHAFMKNWGAYNAELPLLSTLIERTNIEADLMFRGANY